MENIDDLIRKAQIYEITEHHIYAKLASSVKQAKNKDVLMQLANGSLKHYKYWEKLTKKKESPNKFKVFLYSFLLKVLGLTFTIKLMEASEKKAEELVEKINRHEHKYDWIIHEEKMHEKKVIELIDEDFLKYVSSVVLGANDALVGLTGTAAGLSFAMHNSILIGVTCFITGITAALSMGSSEFLSSLSEKSTKKPFKAGVYTGLTYVLTVLLLVFPYFFIKSHYVAFAFTLLIAVIIISFFSYYLSIIRNISFKKRLIQNVLLSFGVAIISFGIGVLVHTFFNLDV